MVFSISLSRTANDSYLVTTLGNFYLHYSEEVAFYNGNKKEQTILLNTFKMLVDHCRNFIHFRFYMGLVDNIVAKCKYLYNRFLVMSIWSLFSITDIATLVGYTVVSRPFLDLANPKYLTSSHCQR